MDAAEKAYLEQIRAVMPGPFAGDCAPGASVTLGDISRRVRDVPPAPAPQAGHDLVALAAGEAARLLGAKTGRALARALEESFVVTTANHHGLDTHPEFLQGVIVFALDRLLDAANPAGVVPVLSTGEVPMSNMAFPQGIFLGRPKAEASTAYHRFSLFKPKSRKTLVSLQAPFTADDVTCAGKSLAARPFLPFEREILRVLLDEICGQEAVLGQASYADQATVFNALLWPRLFGDAIKPPHLVELDKAELARKLIIKDLSDEHSLIHALLFQPKIRRALLAALSGTLGCWRCQAGDMNIWSEPVQGTVLFWGVDDQGRAFGLGLAEDGHLVSKAQPQFRLSLNPADLSAALERKRILPGLYLSFAAIAIARGLVCCGGAYQTGYLAEMRSRTAAALHSAGESALAQCIGAPAPAPMTTGLMPLRFCAEGEGRSPYPAGPVEILAAGGLTPAHLEALAGVPAHEAFALYLAYQYEDIIAPGKRIPGWLTHLAPRGGVVLGPGPGRALPLASGEGKV